MNIAIFPTRDASPPLVVAFSGSVWCLRLEVAFFACVRSMLLFPQTQIIVTTRLPALIYTPSAPSLYTAAPVSLIGYTTYVFRHWGSDFLVRATEKSTSRYRITALPYQFFSFHHRKTHLPIAQTASPSTDAPFFPKIEKNVSNVTPLKPRSPFD